jgi:hypothetical protein
MFKSKDIERILQDKSLINVRSIFIHLLYAETRNRRCNENRFSYWLEIQCLSNEEDTYIQCEIELLWILEKKKKKKKLHKAYSIDLYFEWNNA